MSLFDFLRPTKIPAGYIGRNAIVLNVADARDAEPLIAAIEARFGAVVLLTVGAYGGARAALAIAGTNAASLFSKLTPARVVVIGNIDAQLVGNLGAPVYWINADAAPATHAKCAAVTCTTATERLPHAVVTGDHLLNIDAPPVLPEANDFCDRFREFRERNRWVGYFAATGAGEEDLAYLTFMQLSRKAMGIMCIAPRDTARYEPVYRDAIKYRLPTNRHLRLITSYIPHKTRIYYIEDAAALMAMYRCADFVVAGATLSDTAMHAPDIVTPLSLGKPVIVGMRRDARVVRAALAANVAIAADDAVSIGAVAQALLSDAAQREDYAVRGAAWVAQQIGARERAIAVIE